MNYRTSWTIVPVILALTACAPQTARHSGEALDYYYVLGISSQLPNTPLQAQQWLSQSATPPTPVPSSAQAVTHSDLMTRSVKVPHEVFFYPQSTPVNQTSADLQNHSIGRAVSSHIHDNDHAQGGLPAQPIKIKYLGLVQIDGTAFALLSLNGRVYSLQTRDSIVEIAGRVEEVTPEYIKIYSQGKVTQYDK